MPNLDSKQKMLQRTQEFRFSLGGGCCIICKPRRSEAKHEGPWMTLKKLACHADTPKHRQNWENLQLRRSQLKNQHNNKSGNPTRQMRSALAEMPINMLGSKDGVANDHSQGWGHRMDVDHGRRGEDEMEVMGDNTMHDWAPALDASDHEHNSLDPNFLNSQTLALALDNQELWDALSGRVRHSAGASEDRAKDKEDIEILRDALMEMSFQSQSMLNGSIANLAIDGDGDSNDEFEGLFERQASSYHQHSGNSAEGEEWFPYPNEQMLHVDILFNSPRIRFSRQQMKAVLSFARAVGARNIPSFYAYEQFKADLEDSMGASETKEVITGSGNRFYINSIMHSLALDYADPRIRQNMQVYPERWITEDGKARVSEAWHSLKWLLDALGTIVTLMVRHEGKRFFADELLICASGELFVPKRFYYKRIADNPPMLHVLGHQVECHDDRILFVSDLMSDVPVSLFGMPFPEVQKNFIEHSPNWTFSDDMHSQAMSTRMPHPWRSIREAEDLDIEAPPLIIFMDDMSGNTSRQWNVHYSIYSSLASLPRQMLDQEGSVRFVATSPHAPPLEMLHAVRDVLRESYITPHRVWDAVAKKHVLISPWLLLMAGDNPMQAEFASSIGLHGNFPCRCCMVGGTEESKRTDEGFMSLLTPGEPRTSEHTLRNVAMQLEEAIMKGGEAKMKTAVTRSGVKDVLCYALGLKVAAIGKELRDSTRPADLGNSPAWTEEQYQDLLHDMIDSDTREQSLFNPLFSIPAFDPNTDTPVKCLHTFLLGTVKYFWTNTILTLTTTKNVSLFRQWLSSYDQTGLDVPKIPVDYIINYSGALIGKHFKTLVQVMPFIIHDLVNQELLECWLRLGQLAALIWQTDIPDIQEYAEILTEGIQSFLDATAKVAPGVILSKLKFHILTHLPDHILRFSTALLFSTERYEAYNRIFRGSSIHSNRQAPSRDIAINLARFRHTQHLFSGGFWVPSGATHCVRAGRKVLSIQDRYQGYEHIKITLKNASLQTCDGNSLPTKVKRKKSQPSSTPGEPIERTNEPASAVSVTIEGANTLIGKTIELRVNPILRSGHTDLDDSTESDAVVNPLESHILSHRWTICESLVSPNGDTVRPGDHIIFITLGTNQRKLGMVREILQLMGPSKARAQPTTSQNSIPVPVVLSVSPSVLKEDPHPTFYMPVTQDTDVLELIESPNVICVINCPHNCSESNCYPTRLVPQQQERRRTTHLQMEVEHVHSGQFILNLCALHNARHLRTVIPSALLKRCSPPPVLDRNEHRRQCAASLHDRKARAQEEKVDKARKQLKRQRKPIPLTDSENRSENLHRQERSLASTSFVSPPDQPIPSHSQTGSETDRRNEASVPTDGEPSNPNPLEMPWLPKIKLVLKGARSKKRPLQDG